MAVETSYRICPLCEACCGLEVAHEDGRVVSVRGAENSPFSQVHICPKGVALADLHDDPDRLRHMDEPGGMMFKKAAAFAANTKGAPGSGRGVKVGRRTMKSGPFRRS